MLDQRSARRVLRLAPNGLLVARRVSADSTLFFFFVCLVFVGMLFFLSAVAMRRRDFVCLCGAGREACVDVVVVDDSYRCPARVSTFSRGDRFDDCRDVSEVGVSRSSCRWSLSFLSLHVFLFFFSVHVCSGVFSRRAGCMGI